MAHQKGVYAVMDREWSSLVERFALATHASEATAGARLTKLALDEAHRARTWYEFRLIVREIVRDHERKRWLSAI